MAFALSMTVLVVIVAGLVPAVRAVRTEPGIALRGGAMRGSTGSRDARLSVLVGGQVAIAIAVFFAATLLVRSLARMQGLDRGFEGDDIVLLNFFAPYPLFQVPPAFVSNLEQVSQRLRGRAGVIDATPTLSPPLVGVGGYDAITPIEGQTMEEAVRNNPYLSIEVVAPEWFAMMRVPIRRGRAFSASDDERAAPVVIVNEATARALWPGQDPIGRRINSPWPGKEDVWWTVVGVAADTRYRQMLEPRPTLYYPHPQLNLFVTPYLLIRTRRLSADLLPAVQAAFDEADPSLRVMSATPLATLLDAPLARPRFGGAVLSVFALIALVLATVGVYGVMAALVGARTREFGIRMVLGASGGDVWRMVVRRGMLVALAGAVAGLAISLAMARLIESLLFGVGPRDATSLAVASAAALIAAFVACTVPAARAATVEPSTTLRSE
jgi:predicted permease